MANIAGFFQILGENEDLSNKEFSKFIVINFCWGNFSVNLYLSYTFVVNKEIEILAKQKESSLCICIKLRRLTL